MLMGVSTAWAEDETIASATFNGKNETYTEGWSTTGTGKGRTDCIIIGSGENITSPSFDLSNYSSVTISVKARRYGTLTGSKATIDASIAGSSLGTTDANGTTATTALTDITFTPTAAMTAATIVFTCTNATSAGSSHGAGINSIVIKGTKKADPTVSSITLSATSLDFGKVNFGATKALTFTVTPANLTSDLAISCDNNKYEVSPTSIVSTETTEQTITVTAKPTALTDDMSGTITISGGGLTANKTVTLTTTVKDPNANDGSQEKPFTVAEAITETPASGTSENVYVTGIVSAFYNTNIVSDGSNYRYYISDDGTTANQLLVYKGTLNGSTFTNVDDLLIGDKVVIYGGLTTYNNAPEIASGNNIVSRTRKEVSSIALSGTYTTTFVEGSEFNHDGVVVTATYSDETTEDVTAKATFSEPDMTATGEQTVTVTYNGKTATYTITITSAPTHTATFSINGTTSTQDFKEGAAITFPSVTAPGGYTFIGWSTSEITGEQDTAPEVLVTEANMGTADADYYAVFAIGVATPATLTKMASTDTFADGDKVVIVANYTNPDAEETTSYAIYQETTSKSWVGKYEFDGEAASVAADDKNWLTVTADENNWKLGDDTNGYLYSSGSNNLNLSTESSSSFTLAYSDNNGFTLKYGDRWLAFRSDTDNFTFRLGGNGGTPLGVGYFDIYKFIAGSATYSNYCTSVSTTATITLKAACTDGEMVYGTYSNSKAFVVSEDIVVSEISIVDGKLYVEDYETGDVVPANTGVMVSALEGGDYTVNLTSETGTSVLGEDNCLRPTGNGLTAANMAATDANCLYYRLTMHNGETIGFWWGAVDGAAFSIAANKAYMAVPKPKTTARQGFAFADETTGIETTMKSSNETRGEVYNLQGQRVVKAQKGLYIVNGKKVIMK